MKPATKPDFDAIYADLARLPEGVVGEIIDGELHAHPRPRAVHGWVHSKLLAKISNSFDDDERHTDRWTIITEPECHLSENVLVSDIGGWRLATMPELPDSHIFTIRPDWVCEVLSPSTIVADRNRKLPIFAAAGVGHAWLVDPVEQTVEIFELCDSHTQPILMFAGTEVLVAPPFESLEVDLRKIWSRGKKPGSALDAPHIKYKGACGLRQ